MEKTVNPSKPITEGQIGKFYELLSARFRKSPQLQSKPFQTVLEKQETALVDNLFAVITKMVDAVSEMIVRTVKVNRTLSPKEALDATGRAQYTDKDVVAKMPKGDGEETEVFFFKLGRFVSDNDLDKEYELRGLKPADPYSVAKVNQDDPAFADEHPNGTHWKDEKGKWCCATFRRWDGGVRDVGVHRDDYGWRACWWFAGVRK